MGAWISRVSMLAQAAGRMRMLCWWETLTNGPLVRYMQEEIARIDAQIRQVRGDTSLDPITKDHSLRALSDWRENALEDLERAKREGS